MRAWPAMVHEWSHFTVVVCILSSSFPCRPYCFQLTPTWVSDPWSHPDVFMILLVLMMTRKGEKESAIMAAMEAQDGTR